MVLERVQEDDAKDFFNFYKEIKNKFQDKRDKLDAFIKAFKDCKKQRDLASFVEKMKKILEGHEDLILKFNTFMPNEYKIMDGKCGLKRNHELEDAKENLIKIKKIRGSLGEKKQICIDDAKMYLIEIKDAFKDDKEKFNEFLSVMKDFRSRRIDVLCLMSKLEELFKGHKELLLKFNIFLPVEGYEVSLEQKKPVMNVQYAIKYLGKVKTRFQHESHIYQSFMNIMNLNRKGDKSVEEVRQMVISLFQGHPDLVDGFIDFLK